MEEIPIYGSGKLGMYPVRESRRKRKIDIQMIQKRLVLIVVFLWLCFTTSFLGKLIVEIDLTKDDKNVIFLYAVGLLFFLHLASLFVLIRYAVKLFENSGKKLPARFLFFSILIIAVLVWLGVATTITMLQNTLFFAFVASMLIFLKNYK